MAGVIIAFFFSDSRQKFKKVDLKKKFPYLSSNFWKTEAEVVIWQHPAPLESIFFLTNFFNVSFLSSTLLNDSSVKVLGDQSNYYWNVFFLKTQLHNYYYLVDLSCFFINKSISVCKNASCFFKGNFIEFYYPIVNKPLLSLSKLYSSFIWVEREAKEFYNIYFNGLKDSRRLLTDYTVLINEQVNYKTTGYNHLTQDLYY